jgi:MFS family permease
MDVPAVLRDQGFWWISLAFFLQTFASIAIGVHLIAYLTERGDGATFAATATGLIGAAQVAARIATTVLEGRFSLISLTAIVFAVEAIAIAVLVLWQAPAGVIVAVVMLGMGRGAVTLIRPALIAQLYGRASFGAISGVQTLILTGARALAPVAAGAGYAVLGGYTPVLWVLAVVSVLSGLALLPAGRSRSRGGLPGTGPR